MVVEGVLDGQSSGVTVGERDSTGSVAVTVEETEGEAVVADGEGDTIVGGLGFGGGRFGR